MSKKLYVGNLAHSASEQSLKDLFSQCGTVADAKIAVDHKKRSKGFAFVEMETEKEAAAAITKFHGAIFEEQLLTVNLAKPPENRDIRRVLANRRNRGRR